jgi:glycosyltransferase involved in cell wall biosynthesis
VDAIADGPPVTGGSPLRIVHIASGDGWGGAERVIIQLVEAARHDGSVSVEVLLLNDGRVASVIRDMDVPVHIINEVGIGFLGLTSQLRRWLADRRFDVVHTHRYKEILITALALAPRRSGFVVTVHGLEPSAQLRWSQLPRVWGSLAAAISLRARIVAVSRELERRLAAALGRRNVVCIHNPMPRVGSPSQVPDLRAQMGWDSGRQVVGFIGRLEHVKGPDRFVAMAARHDGDAGFVLIGGGSLEQELRARVLAQNASDRIALAGEVPDASAYMAQFDVLAIPSRHEGLPLVALEAAAFEIPVVAFDVGGISEVLDGGPAARLVPAGDEATFLATVETALADGDTAKQEAARWSMKVRSEFESSAVWAQYKRVYEDASASMRRRNLDGIVSTS